MEEEEEEETRLLNKVYRICSTLSLLSHSFAALLLAFAFSTSSFHTQEDEDDAQYPFPVPMCAKRRESPGRRGGEKRDAQQKLEKSRNERSILFLFV